MSISPGLWASSVRMSYPRDWVVLSTVPEASCSQPQFHPVHTSATWGDSSNLSFTDQKAEAMRLDHLPQPLPSDMVAPSQGSHANAASRSLTCAGSRAVTASNTPLPWDSHNSGVCAQGPAHTCVAENRVSPQLSPLSPPQQPSRVPSVLPPEAAPCLPPWAPPGQGCESRRQAHCPSPGSKSHRFNHVVCAEDSPFL